MIAWLAAECVIQKIVIARAGYQTFSRLGPSLSRSDGGMGIADANNTMYVVLTHAYACEIPILQR